MGASTTGSGTAVGYVAALAPKALARPTANLSSAGAEKLNENPASVPAVKRRRRTETLAGRDTFHVLDPSGVQLAVKGAAPHALTVAQKIAEKSPDEIVLTVDRRSLFGPAVQLYRVTRAECGTVFTHSNYED